MVLISVVTICAVFALAAKIEFEKVNVPEISIYFVFNCPLIFAELEFRVDVVNAGPTS